VQIGGTLEITELASSGIQPQRAVEIPAAVPLSRRNLVALDGLRGLAILMVMFAHAVDGIPPGGSMVNQIVQHSFTLGWAGVDLFFVLSGFLITGILLETRECTNYFSSFYCRRALRIFPLSYSFLLMAFLVFPYVVQSNFLPIPADRWLYPCYLMNWHALWKDHMHANILGHFWTLCVEEQFYVIWPLVVLALRPRLLLRLLLVLEVAIVSGRASWVWIHGPSRALAFATITRMDGLILGAVCALVVRRFQLPRRVIGFLPSIGAFWLSGFVVGYQLAGDTRRESFVLSAGVVFLAIGFAAILMYAVLTNSESTWLQKWLRYRPLTRLGKYSYGIYMFHVPIFYFGRKFAQHLPGSVQESVWASYLLLAVQFVISYVVASISYKCFEKRFLALKDHFQPEYRAHVARRTESA
jgi:peptidoglycan/LPS O-acetylase OafA/YrhL